MIYQYKCKKCGREFEEINSVKDMYNAECCGEKADKLITSHGIGIGWEFRDANGEIIWFPKDGKPYFDKALRRTFTSPEEKRSYMRRNRLVMDGSSNPSRWPVEAGDMRSKAYRRANRLED